MFTCYDILLEDSGTNKNTAGISGGGRGEDA